MQLKLTRAQSAEPTVYTPGGLIAFVDPKAQPLMIFATMELGWNDDKPDESCVPVGTYQVRPYLSPEKGLVYRLHNPELKVIGWGEVPAGYRSAIEIHPGNWARQSLGCILVGLAAGELADPTTRVLTPAVLDSDNAMIRLRRLLGPAMTHTLSIELGEPACKPSPSPTSTADTKKV